MIGWGQINPISSAVGGDMIPIRKRGTENMLADHNKELQQPAAFNHLAALHVHIHTHMLLRKTSSIKETERSSRQPKVAPSWEITHTGACYCLQLQDQDSRAWFRSS